MRVCLTSTFIATVFDASDPCCHLRRGPISESMLNPVRALGPCMVITDLRPEVWNDHYVYWVGPIIGALLAAAVYR